MRRFARVIHRMASDEAKIRSKRQLQARREARREEGRKEGTKKREDKILTFDVISIRHAIILQPKVSLPVVERVEKVVESCVSESDGREDERRGGDDTWRLEHAQRSGKTGEDK